MMRHLSLAVALAPLGGCGFEALDRSSTVLSEAARPAYVVGQNNRVMPQSCLDKPRPGFGSLAPGCRRDIVFAAQADQTSDLVLPRQAGPTPSRPSAAAAYRYIYGVEPASAASGSDTAQPSRVDSTN